MRYTAKEILDLAGVEKPEEKLGAIGITIAGVTVNRTDHVVNLQDAKTCEVVVGDEKYDVALPEGPQEVSEDVRAAKEADGRAQTAKIEARKKKGKEK